MKKVKALTLLVLLLILTISCSNNATDVNKQNGRQKEITILLTDFDYSRIEYAETLLDCKLQFEKERGVKVNFDIITANNNDEYEKKKNAKLYLNDGPTLIFISEYNDYKNYTEQGIAVDVKDKVPNLAKIYKRLLADGDYFVPIGMDCRPIILDRSAIAELGLDDPKPDWTREDFLRLKEMWLKHEPKYFTRSEYWELLIPKFNELDIFDEENKTISLNSPEIIECIKDIRKEIFSDKYILSKDYVYENYYNMVFEMDSEEANLEEYIKDSGLIRGYPKITGGLKSLEVATVIDDNSIVLPNVIYGEDEIFEVWGFIVNSNGKNIELGMEFINELLEGDIQLEMFTQQYSAYPVNKEIEDDIKKIEKERGVEEKAIELREYLLNQIELGGYKHSTSSRKKQEIQGMIYLDFVKYVFADEPYSDEELSTELQKLEDKYRIWLNE